MTQAPAQTAQRWPAIGLALAAIVIALDQLTKHLMLGMFGPAALAPGCRLGEPGGTCPRIEISSILDFSMVWNRGVSFGMLQADSGFGRWALVVFSAAVALGLAWWLWKGARPLVALALGLVIGGAIGNMIDRIRFGAVVDFLDFSGPWLGLHIGSWPVGFPWVFNVADASISVGAVLLVAEILLVERAQKEA